MVKATFKNIAISLAVLVLAVGVFAVLDSKNQSVAGAETFLRVSVVDLENKPVHNVQVSVDGQKYLTDNKGLSPNVQIIHPKNCYDSKITQWYTVNVVVKKEGYVTAVVFNCVVYSGHTRKLTVKIYPADSSDLPYVSYVESPPNQYVLEQIK